MKSVVISNSAGYGVATAAAVWECNGNVTSVVIRLQKLLACVQSVVKDEYKSEKKNGVREPSDR